MDLYSSSLYKYSPVWMQESLLSTFGRARKILREERHFERLLLEALERQYWSADRLQDWQHRQLKRMLRHALTNVPYYRERVVVPDLDHFDPALVLKRFPILRKSEVIAAREQFISSRFAGHIRIKQSTSGTTGAPLTVYQTLDAVRKENALVWRQMHWAGFRSGDRRVWMRGDMIVPSGQNDPPYWRHNYSENMLMMSSYHLSEKSAASYLEALKWFRPRLIQAYPSAISYLASWLSNRGLTARLESLQGIITSSEGLSLEQQKRVEATFQVPVFNWYGSSERAAAIGTCEHGRLHVIADAGHVELIKNDSGLHEIVGTGFNNDMMPLIRYSTDDFVELSHSADPCQCGRHFPLVKRILGRESDVVKTPTGRVMGLVDHIYNELPGIAEAQIVQPRLDSLEIRVVPMQGQPLPMPVRNRLVLNLQERVGPELNISVIEVEMLPRTRNGKVRPIISHVS